MIVGSLDFIARWWCIARVVSDPAPIIVVSIITIIIANCQHGAGSTHSRTLGRFAFVETLLSKYRSRQSTFVSIPTPQRSVHASLPIRLRPQKAASTARPQGWQNGVVSRCRQFLMSPSSGATLAPDSPTLRPGSLLPSRGLQAWHCGHRS